MRHPSNRAQPCAATTPQAEPLILQLDPGQSLLCLEGRIWATQAGPVASWPVADEILQPGDALTSSRRQAYCLSALGRQPFRYAVLRGACA